LQGRLSGGVMARLCEPKTGLFPAPKEISFQCSCPDWAWMGKHVAAVLYGGGGRLGEEPGPVFLLRRGGPPGLRPQAATGLAAPHEGADGGEDPRFRRPVANLRHRDGSIRPCRVSRSSERNCQRDQSRDTGARAASRAGTYEIADTCAWMVCSAARRCVRSDEGVLARKTETRAIE